ncbi:MAG: DUF11 domain-containing protein [Anaerolineae bacterium]|nr:DUF11 domain-containing protein [Anaerolineae bacterium]
MFVALFLTQTIFATPRTSESILSTPDLQITKSGPATAFSGDRITYTLTILNNGTISATGLLVTDTLPLGSTYITGGMPVGNEVHWTIPSLAEGGAMTTTMFVVTATHTITNDDYAVTASGGYSATGTLPVVTLVGDPVLSIDKSGPLTAFVGETITYTLTAVNNGVMTATNVTITDTLPAGATYVSGGTLNGDEVQWAGLELAPDGGSVVVEFAVTGVSTLTNADYRVSADGGFDATGTTTVVTLVGDPQLAITKQGPDAALPGDPIQYTLSVVNTGVLTATGVMITDTLPTGATWQSGGMFDGTVVNWTLAELPPDGVPVDVQFTVTSNTTLVNDDYFVQDENGFGATGTTPVVTAVGFPDLAITKTGPAWVLPGELITYTLTVVNSGVYTATNLDILDVVPNGATYVAGGTLVGGIVNWDVAELAPGDAVDVQFSVTAMSTIVNDSYGVSADLGIIANGTVAVTTIVGTVDLSLSKSGPATAFVGEDITYDITVVNGGLITATSLLVTDTLPTGSTYVSGGTQVGDEVHWNIAALDPMSQTTVQFVVTAADTIVNAEYAVSADNGASAVGSNSVTTIVGDPALAIAKTGPETAYINENITYELTVSNSGNMTATNLIVTDALPAGAVYVGSTTGGILDGGNVRWTVSSLPPGEQIILDFTVRRATSGVVVNDTYAVTAFGGFGATGSVVVTTVVGDPALTVSKTGPALVLAGDLIEYSLTIENNGTLTATNVLVSDTVPAGATYVSGGSEDGGVVTWMLSSLPPASQVVRQFVVTRATPGTVINDDYGASADGGFGASGSPSVITQVGAPTLQIVKSGPGSALPGQHIEYTLHISNTGSFTSTALLITDTVPVGATYVSGGTLFGDEVRWNVATLAPDESVTVNFTVTALNTIVNRFYGVRDDNGYAAVGLVSVVTAIGEPNLSVSKTGPASAYSGDDIVYTLTAQNTGALTATNVIITDVLPVGATWVSGGSYNNGLVTWTVPELAVDEVIQRQLKVQANSTIVNADYGISADGGFFSAGFPAVITVVGEPDLSITKSGPATAFVGEHFSYDLTVTNNGTLTATTLIMTDSIPVGATYVSGGSRDGSIVTWTRSELGPDSDTTVSYVVMVENPGTIVNDNYGVVADRGFSGRGSDSVTTHVGNPTLSITKSGPATVFINELFTYELTVMNSGTLTATGLVITDIIPAGATYVSGGMRDGAVITWELPELVPGDDASVFFTVRVENPGIISNGEYGVAADGGFGSSGSNVVVTVVGDPALEIHKRGPATAFVGDPILYTLTLTNTGTLTATGLVVTDLLPVGTQYVSGGSFNGTTVSWMINELGINAVKTRQFTVRATAAGTVVNDNYGVVADGGFNADGVVAVTTEVGDPLLQISKGGPVTAFIDDPIVYTLWVTNTGTLAATGLVITDVVPSGATYVSGGTFEAGIVSWSVPNLEPEQSISRQFTVVSDAARTLVNDTYGVSADGDLSTSGVRIVRTLVGDPVLSISKSGPATALSGEPIVYDLTIANTGTMTATQLLVRDQLPAGAVYVSGGTLVGSEVQWTIAALGPGATVMRQFTVTATDDIVNDTYNVLDENGFGADGTVSVTTLVGLPSLTIVKSGPASADPGDPITYGITVANTSSLFEATNLIVRDALPAGATYVSGGDEFDGNDVIWNVSALAPGTEVVLYFTVMASSDIVNDDYEVSADNGVQAVGTVAVTTEIGAYLIFLPNVLNVPAIDEPNDTCSTAYPIQTDRTYEFLPDDQFDWYVFDLNQSGSIDLEIRLSDFVPEKGQMVVYKGSTCQNAEFKAQNTETSTVKIIALSNQTAGRYYIGIANDGNFSDQDYYKLRVSVQ